MLKMALLHFPFPHHMQEREIRLLLVSCTITTAAAAPSISGARHLPHIEKNCLSISKILPLFPFFLRANAKLIYFFQKRKFVKYSIRFYFNLP
jgi:hypothetical protein